VLLVQILLQFLFNSIFTKIMGLVQEFKDFAVKGNVIDLAVGVIIGDAFGKIVSSVVGDLIMPPIGLLIGGVNFKDLKAVIGGTVDKPVTLNYGSFIQTTFDFIIIALAIFIFVKAINSMKKAEAPAPPAGPTADQKLLTEIRDLLAKK
jgi:large conductance mechanosensitive channel